MSQILARVSNAIVGGVVSVVRGEPDWLAKIPVLPTVYRSLVAFDEMTVPDEEIRVDGDRFQMYVNPSASGFGREFYQFGNKKNEAAFEQLFAEACFDGMNLIDVGANWGYFCLMVAEICDPERIVAFEPHPTNVRLLRRNIELNGVDATVEEYAASNTTGDTVAWQNNDDLESTRLAPGSGERTVETIRLDDYLLENDIKADLIKIDVEGAEGLVLDGLSGGIEKVGALAIELHQANIEEYGSKTEEIVSTVLEVGFDLVHIDNDGMIEQIDTVPQNADERFAMSPNTVHVLFAVRPESAVADRLPIDQMESIAADQSN